ncbi:PorP/SprF family type IX secretion system membrane protein [Dyadobacter sp. LHD-138]|uniref:PorP/SprF family type IX secretion system membrane protein n=1 Tax=Dyadobacter sp. LHD-138 TaxID=3071413 RepID=UPI0027E005ED|nr:PorP/SprF family type IX secretion system membrane protein [Dyadobacter sp. LHD-138]MDQ6476800.1 PorP/SprF family type IX secretion system membrane protein [Dyadobacter sp. LHD-138]
MMTSFQSRIFSFLTILAIFGFSAGKTYAQREVLYEQYLQNPMAINPAFTGVRETFNMTAMFRRKWFTIPNSPTSQTFAADGTFGNGKFGVGFQALNDQTSYFTTTAFSASFAYHLAISDTWKLALGGQGGINLLPVFDVGSSLNSNNRALGSVGIGAWLRSENLYLGVSKPELLSQSFGQQQIATYYRRPLYVMVGGSYDLADDVKLLPNLLLVQEKDYKLRVDVGGRVWFNEKVGVGATYRTGGGYSYGGSNINYLQLSAEVMVGRNVRLGYFYSTKQIEQFNATSSEPKGIHELMLKFVPNPNGFQKY